MTWNCSVKSGLIALLLAAAFFGFFAWLGVLSVLGAVILTLGSGLLSALCVAIGEEADSDGW